MATIRGTTGQDTLAGGTGPDEILGREGDDLILIDGIDSAFGGSGNDRLDSVKGDWDQFAGAPTLAGGEGDDTYVWHNDDGTHIQEDKGEGVDTLLVKGGTTYPLWTGTLAANVENLTVEGAYGFGSEIGGNDLDNVVRAGDGGFSLYGGKGDDTLIGGKGNDSFSGGPGLDVLKGGKGDDLYKAESGDRVVESDGGGFDTVLVTGNGVVIEGEVERIELDYDASVTVRGTDGANTIVALGFEANSIAGAGGRDTVSGGDGDDRVGGGGGDDLIAGGRGRDSAFGGDGDDTLYGGSTDGRLDSDADWLEGGAGDDTYVPDADPLAGWPQDRIKEEAGGGRDTVVVSLDYVLGANLEDVIVTAPAKDVEVRGNERDNTLTMDGKRATLWGLDGDDTLIGGSGEDLLDGGSGRDRMDGGEGSDRYVVSSTADVVTDSGVGDSDRVTASASFTLGKGLEELILSGAASSGTGNEAANRITGNNAANTLWGAGGHDRLEGQGGADTLYGGGDDDSLAGGGGDDVVQGGAGNDGIQGGSGNDRLVGGDGSDVFLFDGGRDQAADFALGQDVVAFDDALWGEGFLSVDELLAFAEIEGGAAVFDFGEGNILTLAGVSDLADLKGSLSYF